MFRRITSSAKREMKENDYRECLSEKLFSKRATNSNTLLQRFDGRSMLLLRALLSGDASRAMWVYRRQRRLDPDLTLHTFLETLCQDEICNDKDSLPLTAKPLVCLFPEAFQHTLLSFIHIIYATLPGTIILRLIDCLMQQPTPNPWTTSLAGQLKRDLGDPEEGSLVTPQCAERLRKLSEHLGGVGNPTGWTLYFSSLAKPQTSSEGPELPDRISQRKRKSSFVDVDPDTEGEAQQRKRLKRELCSVEGPCSSNNPTVQTDGLTGINDAIAVEVNVDSETEVVVDYSINSLPDHIKGSTSQIKELLENKMEWDQSSVDVLKVLNECDPPQMEVLCGMLRLSELPEQTLLPLCSALLTLSPDLSYSSAVTLIRHLLLTKVVSLSEAASRCLVSAVKSLCSRYPRPTCHALIGPVLQQGRTGNAQAVLFNRLIEDCFEPHYRLLLFEMTLKVVWSEELLTVIHGLLDSKLGLNEELFTQFTEQLNSQAHLFTKSMKFAKMMLTVLTKYNNHVTLAHKQSLSCCLSSSETFLKKSLQAALKRISPT
uniref:Fanconi anemia group E protein n=1 Tax=Osmerus mordax TaxID=8014 RepID=C1BLS7_OSMMO|nr:Fanconi anemia group E protein [Osmerus mordax]